MLISGGNLIKKVLFPAEVLPIVTVLSNMVHFFLGLLILAAFMVWCRWPVNVLELAWFPVAVLVQLILTMGFAFLLSALTVHFRDIRDILGNLMTFWFFATPIIYSYIKPDGTQAITGWAALLRINPFTHLAIVPRDPVFRGARRSLALAPGAGRHLGRVVPVRLLRLRPSSRHAEEV